MDKGVWQLLLSPFEPIAGVGGTLESPSKKYPQGLQEVPENQVSVGWMGILGWGEVKDTLHCK